MREDEAIARLRLICLPESVRFDLREEASGRIAFTAAGLKAGWRLKLSAGEHVTTGEEENGTSRLTLETPGKAPGLVRLKLSEPATGRALELQAAWPARTGMILDPEGIRLRQNRAISVEELQGWRALVPEGAPGDLQLQLGNHRPVSLPLAGEVSLASSSPLIQAMLAQEGPDAQVNLSLVVSGRESSRLEIRFYSEQTGVEDHILRLGLDRDSSIASETVPTIQSTRTRHSVVHAVDIVNLTKVEQIEAGGSVDLREHLEDARDPWLIQSRLDGRVQRAAVWSSHAFPKIPRNERIEGYVQQW